MATVDNLPTVLTIRHYAGDDFTTTLNFVDSSGVAVDVSTWGLVMLIQPASGATITATITAGVTGTITLSADAAALAGVTPGANTWDLKRADTNRTLLGGAFIVSPDIAA